MDTPRITPIRTAADLEAALARGDQIEFSALANPYEAPVAGQPGAGAWIVPRNGAPRDLKALVDAFEKHPDWRMRAIGRPGLLTRASGRCRRCRHER